MESKVHTLSTLKPKLLQNWGAPLPTILDKSFRGELS